MSDKIKDTASQNPVIGYFNIHERSDGEVFIVAFLFVDSHGFPLEYAFSDEIKINKMQRILYGSTLRKFIIEKVAGYNFLDKIKNKPTLILVNERDLLELRGAVEYPVILIEKNEECTHQDYPDDLKKVSKLIEKCKSQYDIIEPFERLEKVLTESL